MSAQEAGRADTAVPASRQESAREPHGGPAFVAWRPRKLALGILVNGVAPLVVYAVLRPHVGGDAIALAIGAGIPVTSTLARFAGQRRIDPMGVLGALGFGIALLVMAFTGGNAIVLKLHETILTGPIGLACLASVAVRRPLHLVLLRFLARRDPRLERAIGDRGFHRTSMVMTALVGTVLTVHAVALVVLALALPTGTFLVVSRPIGWSILIAGAAALLWYRNRMRSRRSVQQDAGPPAPGEDEPEHSHPGEVRHAHDHARAEVSKGETSQ
jgi:hypothetical protein